MPSYTGDMIRKYRKEKGLTQKQLGELCGIADSNIRKYENGKQNPKIETLQKIADALNIDINKLAMYKISARNSQIHSPDIVTDDALLFRKIELKIKLLNQYKKGLEYVETELENLRAEETDLKLRINKLSDEIRKLKEIEHLKRGNVKDIE